METYTYQWPPVITKPIRTTAPTPEQEPVTLSEAKLQCGIADNSGVYFDDRLRELITEAREAVENDTGLVCYTGEHTYKLTEFPCGDYFELPLRPVTAVTGITYVDTGGTTQTWAASNYVLESSAVIPIVRMTYNNYWPTIRGDINGITVTFTAGYASVFVLPKLVKMAVLHQVYIRWLHFTEKAAEAQREEEAYSRCTWRIDRKSYP